MLPVGSVSQELLRQREAKDISIVIYYFAWRPGNTGVVGQSILAYGFREGNGCGGQVRVAVN